MKNSSINEKAHGTPENRAPRIRELVSYFLRLGTLGFGGPVALCGLMEKELVQDRGWLTKEEMRDAIAVSQSLPGPLAIQVGIFAAYLRGGFWGAWAGGWAFILKRNWRFCSLALGLLESSITVRCSAATNRPLLRRWR